MTSELTVGLSGWALRGALKCNTSSAFFASFLYKSGGHIYEVDGLENEGFNPSVN